MMNDNRGSDLILLNKAFLTICDFQQTLSSRFLQLLYRESTSYSILHLLVIINQYSCLTASQLGNMTAFARHDVLIQY